jgi:RND family efflux transporter MFP subunit
VEGELLTVQPVPWPWIAKVQGSLSANEVSTIAAKVFGRIVEVNCDLGDSVTAGQQLVKLDDREYALRVAQAEAQVAQARAAVGLKPDDPLSGLDPLKSPPVREAQAVLDEAKQTVSRLGSLFSQGAVVATDLEAAQSAVSVADARYNSALNSVREKIALIDVQLAQLQLAKQELADTVVVAPTDGRVLSRSVAVGTYIQVGQPIVELASTKTLRYRSAVTERLAQQLEIGQRVRIHVANQVRETRVTRISPALDPLNRSLAFEAEVANDEETLRSGLFAQAEIILDEQSTALAIPTSAMVRFAGVDKAWRVTDGKVSEAVLQIGREIDGMIEVVGGLSAGDQLLLVGVQGRVGKYVSAKATPAETEVPPAGDEAAIANSTQK